MVLNLVITFTFLVSTEWNGEHKSVIRIANASPPFCTPPLRCLPLSMRFQTGTIFWTNYIKCLSSFSVASTLTLPRLNCICKKLGYWIFHCLTYTEHKQLFQKVQQWRKQLGCPFNLHSSISRIPQRTEQDLWTIFICVRVKWRDLG